MTNDPRLAAILIEAMAVQARIEGMKAANLAATSPEVTPHSKKDFDEQADTLMYLSQCAGNLA